MKRAIPLAILLTGGACRIGPSVKNFRPAHDPGGARVQLTLNKRPALAGELLVIQDSALLVRRDSITRPVVTVPLRLVVRGRVPGTTWTGKIGRSLRERLRLLSRYPYGLESERLQALLAAYDQDSVEVMR